jgi:hypothetical protein
MFTISLDPYTLPPSVVNGQSSDQYKQPVLDAHVRNTSSGVNGLNRWFDKSLTVSIESNGRAGMNGEHSPCDALIPSIMVDNVVAEPIDIAAFSESPQKISGVEYVELGEGQGWKSLDWVVDETINEEIRQAELRAKAIVEDSDASQLWFSEYAADWMRKSGRFQTSPNLLSIASELSKFLFIAKVSPDAYIQLALQLAWYKQRGEFTATYETASTRLFKHGRTDVIRTYSTDTRDFVRTMMDPNASVSRRFTIWALYTPIHPQNSQLPDLLHYSVR